MQAYTVELEAEVNQLKEENMKLKKQQVVGWRCTGGRHDRLLSENQRGGYCDVG